MNALEIQDNNPVVYIHDDASFETVKEKQTAEHWIDEPETRSRITTFKDISIFAFFVALTVILIWIAPALITTMTNAKTATVQVNNLLTEAQAVNLTGVVANMTTIATNANLLISNGNVFLNDMLRQGKINIVIPLFPETTQAP